MTTNNSNTIAPKTHAQDSNEEHAVSAAKIHHLANLALMASDSETRDRALRQIAGISEESADALSDGSAEMNKKLWVDLQEEVEA